MLLYSYMKQPSSTKPIEFFGLAVQALAFIILTVWVVTSTQKEVAPYGDTSRIAVLVDYVLLLLSIPIYLHNRSRARLLSIVMWVVTALVGLVLAPYLLGSVQNLVQGSCAGFFGVRDSCVENWRLGIGIVLFFPIVFIPLSVIFGIFVLIGNRQALNKK